MKLFRKFIFWSHLAAGLIAGISIAIMCFTGVLLAFEKDIVAWAERDARRVGAPEGAAALSIDELRTSVRESHPEMHSPTITLQNDQSAAVSFAAGRDAAHYANPYTGELRTPNSTSMHDFMHVMEDWHRVLAIGGDNRPVGKVINGVCNLAFCALAITGLYLWWPRNLSWAGVKAVAIFNWRLAGRARDFNWHNSIGLWCAPVLIVLTLTAVPISFRWGGTLIEKLAGTAPQSAVPAIPPPADGARAISYDTIIARAKLEVPDWARMTIRSTSPQRGRPERTEGPATPEPITVAIVEPRSWPRTATTTLTFDPFTGELLKREGFADLPAARQVRSWTRFLHTGEALGTIGQIVAGLATLGGLFLVYTGFALSWRRFFGKRAPAADRKSR
jgi:uncharacterized iron-regulated membrane protein